MMACAIERQAVDFDGGLTATPTKATKRVCTAAAVTGILFWARVCAACRRLDKWQWVGNSLSYQCVFFY